MTLHMPRHQPQLVVFPTLVETSRAVTVPSTPPADGHAPSRPTQGGGAQPHLPLGPSGIASAASAAGSPGIMASLLLCAILVTLLMRRAEELRRHRVRVLPARSILAISPHPRPG
jgi:hypothetical protein